ncbi:MAG: MarR family EPS-associated transcriptional regulator [Gammaproteobacteria bacterium]|nr:MarR family EPS-associated transcriptional regulator [Gammaproteobacteria bacterium]
MTADETHYRIFRLIETQPDITQRQLAQALGISLGKVNYCLRALIEKGQVKTRNFQRNPSKNTYVNLLTPKGIEGKAQLTVHFLKCKMAEYELLRQEIEQLKSEVGFDTAEAVRVGGG